MNTQRPFKEMFYLVVVGLGLGLGFNVLHTEPLPWIGEEIQAVNLEDLEGSGADMKATPGDQSASPPPLAIPADGSPTIEWSQPGTGATGDETETATAVESTSPPAETKPPPSGDLYPDIPESEFPINITLAKAKEFYDRGGLLVLDARETEEFAEGRIAGAVSAPADHITGDVDWMDRTAGDPRPVLVYCGGGDCELSLALGFELAKSGHRKVLIYEEGYPAWVDAGYPIEKGDAQ